jgi:hypothetical protein
VVDGRLSVDAEIAVRAPEPEPEFTDAVVVEEPLPDGWLELNHHDPVAARKAYEEFKAAERDRERRLHDSPDGWRTGVGDGRRNGIYEAFREPGIPSPGGRL